MSQSVSVARCLESSIDWSDLPEELLYAILSKLSNLPDYIRFGTVCKSFQSVATKQKQERDASMHTHPPFLIVAKNESQKSEFQLFKLYDIMRNKVYNHEFKIALSKDGYLGSSRGWLIAGRCDSFELFNPFTEKSIKIPYRIPRPRCIKVTLSCDPTTRPNDFVVGVIWNHYLALKKADQPCWTLFHEEFWDIIFHNGLLYAVKYNGRLVVFDYAGNRELVPLVIVPYDIDDLWGHSLVETSNGDLLLVDGEGREYGQNFRIFKLVKKEITNLRHNAEWSWVEILNLENDYSVFLTYSYDLVTSAHCIPNFKYRNCIYFAQSYEGISTSPVEKKSEVFNMNDGTYTTL